MSPFYLITDYSSLMFGCATVISYSVAPFMAQFNIGGKDISPDGLLVAEKTIENFIMWGPTQLWARARNWK